MINIKNICKITISIGFFLLLIGCANHEVDSYYHEIMSPEPVSSIHMKQLQSQLQDAGVNIYQTDKDMTLIIPDAVLFRPHSANFYNKAYYILDTIKDFTDYYEKAVIEVTGFGKPHINAESKFLAEARAQKVVQYLWSQKIDASLIYAKGSNGECFESTVETKQVNYDRIVVHFHKL